MENNEMIYTAIFQNSIGKLFSSRYTGVMNRSEAWMSAAKIGGSEGNCLIALVPGDHPIYFYDNFVKETSVSMTDRTNIKSHDVYEIT
jgi:hypothetical protein